jgi:hypothetical protein
MSELKVMPTLTTDRTRRPDQAGEMLTDLVSGIFPGRQICV